MTGALIVALLAVQPAKKAPINALVIRQTVLDDLWVCAEYTVDGTSKPNRSCQPASVVRQWILMNGRPDDCSR